jgi:hypothetical protein
LGLGSVGIARATVTPIISCADVHRTPVGNDISAWFGYTNSGSGVDIPVDVDNFFSPGVIDRAQPTHFDSGFNDLVFRVTFHLSGSVTQETWFLDGNSVTLDSATALPPCGGAFWAGTWAQPSFPQYALGDIVTHNGASWIATSKTDNNEPGAGAGWTELGSLSGGPTGPMGPRGIAGVQGATGPQGSRGPAGDQVTFPSAVTRTFPHTGRFLIRDPHVGPGSVITIEYMDGHGRPTSVDRLTTGSFVATGTPRRHFRYVVFNQP